MDDQHPEPRAGIDFVGDVHGEAGRLRSLLNELGYSEAPGGTSFAHPDRRTVVFLGDLINSGPHVREVVGIARAMESRGNAVVLAGNHEIDVLRFHSARGSAEAYLRGGEEWGASKFATTFQDYAGCPVEWEEVLRWMRGLHTWIAGARFRAVHACWDETAVERLTRWGRHRVGLFGHDDPGVIRLANGPKLSLPPSVGAFEINGRRRTRIRTRWYLDPKGLKVSEAAFPMKAQMPDLPKVPLPKDARDTFFPVREGDPPVFFGHYAWPQHALPLAPNVACLDLGVSHGGPLAAYRWDGEQVLEEGRFVVV
ncbi:metallophosphoesterase [soil metagenome]